MISAVLKEKNEQQTKLLHKSDIVRSINELTEKRKGVSEVTQFLEESYMASTTQQERESSLNTAKTYLADGLFAIINDIDTISGQLHTFIGQQVSSIDTLDDDVQLVKAKLKTIKLKYAVDRLSEQRIQIGHKTAETETALENYSRVDFKSNRPGSVIFSRSLADDEGIRVASKTSFTRIPLADRITAIEEASGIRPAAGQGKVVVADTITSDKLLGKGPKSGSPRAPVPISAMGSTGSTLPSSNASPEVEDPAGPPHLSGRSTLPQFGSL